MKIFISFFLIVFVSACGLRPMYGERHSSIGGAQGYFSQISISNIPNREGQYLRNALIDRFYQDARPVDAPYNLSVGKISEKVVDLDITKDSDATRSQLKLNIAVSLRGPGDEGEVFFRALKSISSYNVLTSEFATRVSAQNARENALDDLARQIELQLSLYFQRKELVSGL